MTTYSANTIFSNSIRQVKQALGVLFELLNSNKLLITLFILIDFGYIILHFFFKKGILHTPFYSIILDRGYSEFYQYMKEFWVFFILLFVYIEKRQLLYLFWSFFFLFIFLDDSAAIHEYLGRWFQAYLDKKSHSGLRAQDVGELIFSALAGLFFLILGILCFLRSNSTSILFSINMTILVILLAFFGVIIDLVDRIIHSELMVVIEDGGEMLVMSFIVSYVLLLIYHPNKNLVTEA